MYAIKPISQGLLSSQFTCRIFSESTYFINQIGVWLQYIRIHLISLNKCIHTVQIYALNYSSETRPRRSASIDSVKFLIIKYILYNRHWKWRAFRQSPIYAAPHVTKIVVLFCCAWLKLSVICSIMTHFFAFNRQTRLISLYATIKFCHPIAFECLQHQLPWTNRYRYSPQLNLSMTHWKLSDHKDLVMFRYV